MKGGLAARLATAAALIAGLLAALFLLPRQGLALLAGVLCLLAGVEWARLCRLRAAWTYAAFVAVAFAALLFAGIGAQRTAWIVAAVFWLGLVPAWLWRGVHPTHLKLLRPAGFIVIAPAGLAMTALEPQALLAVLALVWIADTAAYFTGRAVGRHKLAPTISPGKTWEGAAGGLIGVLAYAIICGTIIEGVAWVPYIAAAALLAALSIVGDLFESAAKRQAGVKDSGTLLPGHGGVLDRIDSAAAVLPVAVLLLPLARSAS